MPSQLVTILLVEDNDVDIKALKRALRRHKIANPIHVAHDGIEALDALRATNGVVSPYVILLDLNMPRMTGIEFLQELRRDKLLSRSIVFVLTTSEDDKDKAAAYDRQVAGYLSKIDAGADYGNVIHLLEHYQAAVHFPP